LGGDEFAVLLIGIDEQATAVRISDRVIEALREPFIIANEEVLTHASIGIATFPDDATTPETLMRSADRALYAAMGADGQGAVSAMEAMEAMER